MTLLMDLYCVVQGKEKTRKEVLEPKTTRNFACSLYVTQPIAGFDLKTSIPLPLSTG